MNAGFIIRFNGKISWEGRANGLPETICAYLMFDQYNEKICNDVLEKELSRFIAIRGMAVQKDQGQVIDMRQFPQERMFVPMDWIVNITVDAFNMGADLSVPDAEGVERLPDGKEPPKN